MTRKRVVVTGLAALTPLGNDLQTTWDRLVAGESGIGPITLFDASAYDSRIAGEVKNFNPENYMPYKQARRMDRFTQFSVAAGRMLQPVWVLSRGVLEYFSSIDSFLPSAVEKV